MKFSLKGHIKRSEALNMILEKWNPSFEKEEVLLKNSINRVLAENTYSKNCLPVVRSSKLDGIGVRFSDFFSGIPSTENWIEGKDYVRADTGDDFSDEFDTVIAIEDVFLNGEEIRILDHTVEKGMNINLKGATVETGELLACEKTILKPIHLAVLATGGLEKVSVIKKPKVAFIPTGDELIDVSTSPKRGGNIESNSFMIEALLNEWGAEPILYPIVKDNIEEINKSLEDALKSCDIVLIGAGSSRGGEDHNTKLLKNRGGLLQHCVLSGPGRPIGIAIENNIPIINIPGPTVGAFCAMDWCVSALINTYFQKAPIKREKVKVKLLKDMKTPKQLDFYQRLNVWEENGELVAYPLTWDDRIPKMLSKANALFISPIGQAFFSRGEIIEAELLYKDSL